MKIVESRHETLSVTTPDGDEYVIPLVSHAALADEEQHIVRLHFGEDQDVAIAAEDRGRAMQRLGEFLRAVGQELVKQAFLQEGAVRVPTGRKRR